MEANHEKREFSRVSTRFQVEVYPEGGEAIYGHTENVSMRGFFLVCQFSLPVGTKCRVVILLGDQQDKSAKIEVRGTVLRGQGDGIVVSFSEMTMETYNHLKNVVLYNTPETEKVENEFRSHIGIKKRS